MFLCDFAAVDDESSTPDLGGWRCQYRRKMGRTLWSIEKGTRRDGEQKQKRRRSLCSCLASLSTFGNGQAVLRATHHPLHLRRPRFIVSCTNAIEISRPIRFHASSEYCMYFHALRSCTEKYIYIQVTRYPEYIQRRLCTVLLDHGLLYLCG
jgi:hypothetical protein